VPALLTDEHRAALAELAPLARRVAGLDPAAAARLRSSAGRVTLLVRLPFDVLVARTIATDLEDPEDPDDPDDPGDLDVTVRADELLGWLDGTRPQPPAAHDDAWRGSVPPSAGWQRVDTVPDDVVRGLVRQGALTLKQAAEREGVPGAQPRAEVADSLLDSVVLTLTDDTGARTATVTLRSLSALARMGFLPRGSHIAVDVAGRWTRVAAAYGSVFAERAGLGLGVLR